MVSAAVLDIVVKANTTAATAGLHRVDSELRRTSTNASRSTGTMNKYNTTLRKTGTESRQAATNTDRLGRATKGARGSLSTMAKTAIGLGAAYVGLSAAKEAVSATTDLAKSTLTLKKGFGLSVKTGSELGAVLKSRGADASSVGMAFNTLSRQVESAKDGSASAVKAFRTLGISQKDLKGPLKDSNDLLFAISDGLKSAGRGTERNAAQSALFGRGWKTVVPVLREGSDSMKEQLALADKYGASFGGKSINSIKDLMATERELKIAQLGLQVQFTEKIAPALITVGLKFADLIHWISGAVKWVRNATQNFAHWISTTGTLAETFKTLIKWVVQLANWFFKVGKAGVSAAKWIGGAFGSIINAGKGVINWFRNAWGDLKDVVTHPFRAAVSEVRGLINNIISIINTVLGPIGVHIGEIGGGGGGGNGAKTPSATAPHSKKASQKQRGGVMVPGQGSGDKVPALLEPGEFVLNRKAVQAIGLSGLEKFNKANPRFQMGGAVQPQRLFAGGAAKKISGSLPGIPNPPSLSGMADWLKPAGQFVIDKAWDFMKKKVASLVPNVGGDILNTKSGAATLKSLQGSHPELKPGIMAATAALLANNPGLAISSTTGGNHVSGSYHYQGRAVDIGGSSSAMYSASNWVKKSGLYKTLAEGIHNPNLAVDSGHIYSGAGPFGAVWAGHADHIHMAVQRGGKISPHSPSSPKIGSKWLKGVGGNWNPDAIFTALRQLGASKEMASFLSAVSVGESGGNPRAVGHDPGGSTGYGLLQITSPFNDDIIRKYGGTRAMFNPWENLLAGIDVYRRQGPGAWYGHKGGAGHLLKEAITGGAKAAAKTPKAGKSGKTPKGAKQLYADDMYDAALERLNSLIGTENEKRTNINDLLSEGNLQALQTYQAALGQHGVLGIKAPNLTGMQSLMPILSNAEDPSGTGLNWLAENGLLSSPPISAGMPGTRKGDTRHATPGWFGGPGVQQGFHGAGTEVHIHVKDKRIRDSFDFRVEKKQKRTARRGNRPLPGARR